MRSILPLLLPLVLSAAAQEAPKLRLPGEVRPLDYRLDLNVAPAQDTYSGHVSIHVDVLKPVSIVWLNSTGLKLTKATVGSRSAEVVDGGREFAGLKLAEPFPAGKTNIDIDFTGNFSKNDVEGFFKQSEAGNSYVFSQFEPTSARRAFPCFDEPALKVPWTLTLRVPKGLAAFTNTPVDSESEEKGVRVVRFRQTKPLPSYLVAIAVGPFDVVEGAKAGRKQIPTRVLAMKGRAAEARYAVEVTPKIIAALEDYFGMPYPYEKLDQAAIPITVGFGAMENAGLITYQQTILLARPDDDTIVRQRRSTSTITHELAHQWFGNMVTPAWWDDIWLNEAFATWMASRVTAKLFPDWNVPVSAIDSKATVMKTDGMISARKIRQPIEEHGDIGNAFDGITYQKGAAVIRMFENYVGAERFQKGVQAYMRKHMWGNATASDFLASISAAAGKNITPVFSKFLDRGGFPLVSVELQCDGPPRVALSQERSLPLGSKGSRADYWPTPVCLRWEANGKVSRECALVSDPREVVELKGTKSCPAWITANDQGTGYYQLLYKGDAGKKLLAHADKLSVQEKVELLRNAQALVQSGHMPASDALALAREFRKGPERQIIAASMDVVASVRRSVTPDMEASYAKVIREFYGEKAHELGWKSKPGENADDRLLRPDVLEFVAAYGADKQLAAEAIRLTKAWVTDKKAIEPEMVSAVLKVAAWHGGREVYGVLLSEAKKAKSLRDRTRIIKAIGAVRDPEVAREALGLMFTKELDVRELTGLLRDFQESPVTARVPWEFVTANYDKLLPILPSRLGVDGGAILPWAGESFCSTNDYSQVEQFFKGRIGQVSGGARALALTLEKIQLCEASTPAQRPEVAKFLKQYPADQVGL